MTEGGGGFVCRFVGAEGRCLIRFSGPEKMRRQNSGLCRCRRGRVAISRVVPFGDVLGGCIARGGSVGEVCVMQAARWEEGGATCPLRAGFSEGPAGVQPFSAQCVSAVQRGSDGAAPCPVDRADARVYPREK